MYHVFIEQSVPGTTVFIAMRVQVIMDQHGCALFLISLVLVLCDLLVMDLNFSTQDVSACAVY